jgi:hypothetical protein
VVLTDYFRENCQKHFDITEKEVLLTVNDSKTARKLKTIGGTTKFLFLRKHDDGIYILVDGIWRDDRLEVVSAYRLFEQFINEVKSDDPLRVMQHLATRFGMLVQVGDLQSKFIYESTFEVDPKLDKTQLFNVVGGKAGHYVMKSSGFRWERKQGYAFVEISMMYALDRDDYVEWLKDNLADRASALRG